MFESVSEGLIYGTMIDALNKDRVYRRIMALARKSIIHDCVQEMLEQHLKKAIAKEGTRTKLLSLLDRSRNIARDVFGEISRGLYLIPPARRFTPENETASMMYAAIGINPFMRSAVHNVELLNDSIVFVDYDFQNDIPCLRLLDAENCDIVPRPGFPDQMQALMYQVQNPYSIKDGKPENYWVYWSSTENFLFKEFQGNWYEPIPLDKRIAPDGNPGMINPYGVIPAVAIHREYPFIFWDTWTRSGIFDATLQRFFQVMLKNYSLLFNSFKAVYVTGSKVPAGFVMGPEQCLDLGAGSGDRLPEAGVLDLQIDFDQINRDLQFSLDEVHSQFGVTQSNTDATIAAKAILLQQTKRTEIRQEQEPIFSAAEIELFKILRIVWNTRKLPKIPESVQFSIVYREQKSFPSPTDELNYDKARVDNYLMSPTEFFMKYNPGLTPDEAGEKMEKNKDEYKQYYPGPLDFSEPQTNDKNDGDDTDPEDEEI